MRTSTNFAHLASFLAIEFVDRPVQKTLGIFVCHTSENKAFLSKRSTRFNSYPQFPRFPLWPPGTMTPIRQPRNENGPHDHRLRKKHVPHSFICMCQRSCLQHRTWGMGKKWTFELGESTGKLGWKWRIEHKPVKGKWCNFIIWCLVVLYLCLHLYLSFRVCSVRSGEWALEKSHCTLAFKARWCDHRWFFRRTAKNLVAYATSWSLTLSPV